MEQLSKRASHQMRTMLFELRPLALETQGLSTALQVFLDRRQKDIGGEKPRLSLEIKSKSDEIPRQDGKVETTIFAIVQETVNNAIKHAEADHITVTLQETDNAIETIIADDGTGFEVDAIMSNYESRGSLGMVNLQERTELVGGELSIESAPGEGTRITISIPKEKEARLKKRRTTGPLSMPVNMPPKK
jgi:signal transduction histidine kinase